MKIEINNDQFSVLAEDEIVKAKKDRNSGWGFL